MSDLWGKLQKNAIQLSGPSSGQSADSIKGRF